MSEYRATVEWKRQSDEYTQESYNRDHTWRFNDATEVAASAAPEYMGDPQRIDPEQAFVASLSACHMLTLLALAAKQRFVVDEYTDEATGYLEKNEDDKLAITRVVLRPRIRFGGDEKPSAEQIAKLHDAAHRYCFIANSVKTAVAVD